MSGDGISLGLARSRVLRNGLAVLGIIAFEQLAAMNHSTGAIHLAGGHALASQHPLAAGGDLVGDLDLVTGKKPPDKQSRYLFHPNSSLHNSMGLPAGLEPALLA